MLREKSLQLDMAPLMPTPYVGNHPHSDTVHPRGELARAVEFVDRTHNLDKDGLRRILGILRIAKHGMTRPIHAIDVGIVQLVKCLFITRLAPLNDGFNPIEIVRARDISGDHCRGHIHLSMNVRSRIFFKKNFRHNGP